MSLVIHPISDHSSSEKNTSLSLFMETTHATTKLFLTSLLFLLAPVSPTAASRHRSNVEEACSVTLHPQLCVQSLASFSNVAGRSPRMWARAGVSVATGEVKALSRFLQRLGRSGGIHGRTRSIISDCNEVIQDALDDLQRSLGVLRRLNPREFEWQMGDVLTWLSAALTDEDTCSGGLESGLGRRWQRRSRAGAIDVLKRKVTNASYMTSNALALANKLSSS